MTDLIYRQGGEENLPKMMDISKITQGTIEEQMFYHTEEHYKKSLS
jgi:hypothetical protein